MAEYVRTVTTDTSPADTLASAQQIASELEASGLHVTIGDPYTEHGDHPDPSEHRHRVDLTVSDKAPDTAPTPTEPTSPAPAEEAAPPPDESVAPEAPAAPAPEEEPVEEPPVTEEPEPAPKTETLP